MEDKKIIRITDTATDRYATFGFISWWDQKKIREAKVMVVGAGALGNEVLKNLALMGIGYIFIIDFDTIEAANLTRSILFNENDNGRKKAEVAAERVKEINPDVKVQWFDGNVNVNLGLGLFRRMDAIIGCLDNREARLSINRFCWKVNKPWIDGAIQELDGIARVFMPNKGACYECTLSEIDRKILRNRYSCDLQARQDIMLGKAPSTPTISSIIAGIQTQEALKLIHKMEVQTSKGLMFHGLTNDVYLTEYPYKEDCPSHETYGEIIELKDKGTETTSLQEMLDMAKEHLGKEAILELDQEIVISLRCNACNTITEFFKPLYMIVLKCPICGKSREKFMTHNIIGKEGFLNRSLKDIGIPPLHIIVARNSEKYKYFELTGDLEGVLKFG